MNTDKTKIRKLKLPLEKMSKREKDYAAVLLEDVNYNFKAFGESLDAVKKRGNETFEEVGNIKEEITEIKLRLKSIEERLDRLEKNPISTQAEIESLKREGLDLRLYSDDKEIQKRLNFFDKRIGRIEKQLKLSAA